MRTKCLQDRSVLSDVLIVLKLMVEQANLSRTKVSITCRKSINYLEQVKNLCKTLLFLEVDLFAMNLRFFLVPFSLTFTAANLLLSAFSLEAKVEAEVGGRNVQF